ncbi:hypothetical protein [Sporolituus thermophilus]|uniref:Uncharacterized protein n=1 Tax=Sporolituus thermophilus DSM 23256 TaxID=1123285 RepID=A0A1G7MSG0_9FIRM|nr:hypothetical protein [Sporolituus thermophilus]SDF64601.1 hypothetical protein SAMN05660235_02278 [Sporolituus thermophilus DSM 23256]
MQRKYNLLIGLMSVVLTIALLAGGQVLWQKYAVAKPLDKMLQGIDGVESATWEEGTKKEEVKIHVTLHQVGNLPKTYSEITDGSRQILGARGFKIIIHDNRTPELEQFYYRVHYFVQEAIFTGNFALMAERLQEQAARSGVAVQAYVDARHVYLKMTKDGGEMYEVVPRTIDGREVK